MGDSSKESVQDYSCFSTPTGAQEIFLTIQTQPQDDFAKIVRKLEDTLQEKMDHFGLSETTHVFSRIFYTDIDTQKSLLKKSNLVNRLSRSGAISIIQQSPLNAGPVSLLTYHIKPQTTEPVLQRTSIVTDEECASSVFLQGAHYGLLWTVNGTGHSGENIDCQTRTIFNEITTNIKEKDMSLLDNAIRTWVFVDSIDDNYQAMVDERRAFFSENNLTKDTRFIASTGIEGKPGRPGVQVQVDSLSISNITPEQIIRMEAPEYLSPTIVYGVTFERGTRVRFGDRSHLYISGTASIDKNGKVLHEGDTGKQTERTIENIEALLRPHGATIKDMSYLLVYLREPSDIEVVQKVVEERVPDTIPVIFLKGSVCRPTWLVEMEGIGIIPDTSEYPPFI